MYQKAAERGGYGGERYEKLDFQKKVAERYKVLHDVSWKVIECMAFPPEINSFDTNASF